MTQLREFMLLFRYEPGSQEPTAQETAEMHRQWGEFIGSIAMQGKLVSTHQLGTEYQKIHYDQKISTENPSSLKQIIGGNMVLKAESLSMATELAKNCPILLMGGNVEIRDILPMN